MRKIYQISIFVLIPAIALLLAFSAGPPAGYSGSPLDGENCTSCHTPGPAISVIDWIVTDVPVEGYSPNQTYSLVITCNDIEADKYGFQITSETTAAKVGTWVITNETLTQIKGGTAVTHTAAGTAPVGTPNTWSMDWTAPASGTGQLTFYLAVNKTNNNSSNQGDQIYTSSLTIEESTFGIAENLEERIGNLYPNPATDMIRLDAPISSKLRIYDNIGREVISLTVNSDVLNIDISTLKQGIYYMNISHDGQKASRSFVKR
jgi:hypothetical protein